MTGRIAVTGDEMRATLLIVLASVMILTIQGAGATPVRDETHEYTMANGAFVGHGEAHWTLGAEYAVFEVRKGEHAVQFEIVDESGSPVRGHVHVYLDEDDKIDDTVDFCGTTPKPISVHPGATVEVGTIMGLCNDTSPSIVTEGTITATFT